MSLLIERKSMRTEGRRWSLLGQKDPKRRIERRRQREEKRKEKATRVVTKAPAHSDEIARVEKSPSRHVPAQSRDRVFERAGYRCEYQGPDGRRCSALTGLQIEHTRVFAIYRSHDERYLKAYCPEHNRLAAERVYGEEFITEKIEAKRAANSNP